MSYPQSYPHVYSGLYYINILLLVLDTSRFYISPLSSTKESFIDEKRTEPNGTIGFPNKTRLKH